MSLVVWLLTLPGLVFVLLYVGFNYAAGGRKSVCLVVLGDIGRSPRMQYHALSFAREGFTVDFIGYGGSLPHPDLRRSQSVFLYHLRPVPKLIQSLPRLPAYFLKVLWQSIVLGVTLLLTPKSSHMLLQNPPSIPTLFVAWVVSLIRGTRVTVDWHNYGYTILGLTLGPEHTLVTLSLQFEKMFGQLAQANICVTKAMREHLLKNWGIRAVTLYDRPPDMFRETDLDKRHKLFCKLSSTYPVFGTSTPEDCGEEVTAFTKKTEDGDIHCLQNRPALLISSTSWTEDEDFNVLLKALEDYEMEKQKGKNALPNLVCVITGKGPLKEHYQEKIRQADWKHTAVCLPWLEAEDYPLLLGSADLGVCLHKSSSGLDLPMKVVDMFGCGLPVCALNFDCISELVQHGNNGLIFNNSSELFHHIQELLKGFPSDQKKLQELQMNVKDFQQIRWHDQWKKVALPLFTEKQNRIKED